jgi:hypothetical protein
MAGFKWFNDGSIVVLTPQSDEAEAWLDDNVMTPETMRWGRGIVVELRYINDLITGITADGLTVEEE